MTEAPEPELDRYYENLKNYVRMVTGGYSQLLMIDAKGGLGKTHNITETLKEERPNNEKWVHQKGFTTPVELYKTLWKARHNDAVLFLDDMSGITGNTKAIDMLKSATDTQGEENFVEYRTSQSIEHPYDESKTLPNTFCFRGSVIMSFNDTPDNRHFDALMDRGTFYNLTLSYEERLDLIKEIAKIPTFSSLSVSEQMETAEWIETVTDSSYEVTIRTFDEVCKMREFGRDTDRSWEPMALEVFNIDYEKYLIIDLRENSEMSVESQIEAFKNETGKSQSYYYDLFDSIRSERS